MPLQKYKYVIFVIFIIFLIIRYKFLRRKPKYDLNKIPKYMINLERRKDRLQKTSDLLINHGYDNVIRFPAVDGGKFTDSQLRKLVHQDSLQPIFQNKRSEHNQLSRGAVGCYISHINLWDEIIKNNDVAIIFEDDTNPGDSKSNLEKILSNSPNDWDIILFGGSYTSNPKFQCKYFYKVNKFLCLHAYMINKRAIQKIKKHLYPIRSQIDWTISDLISNNILNVYVIKNNKWYQNPDIYSTDIQTPIIKN